MTSVARCVTLAKKMLSSDSCDAGAFLVRFLRLFLLEPLCLRLVVC